MKLFNKFRKRDINLEIGIGVQNEQKSYYIFVERALNTFDETLAYKYAQQNELIQIKQISIKPINEILQTHSIGRIDLLTIDAEGMDLLILQSLDWEKYQPKVVLAESIVDDMLNDPLYAFMIARNYTLIAKTTRTFIFLRKDDI